MNPNTATTGRLTRVNHTIAEKTSPALESAEKDVAVLVAVAAAYMSQARYVSSLPKEEGSTFAGHLSELDAVEGHARSLLFDATLSRCQQARVKRLIRVYQVLHPMVKLRGHIERVLIQEESLPVGTGEAIRQGIQAVVQLGKYAAQVVQNPGPEYARIALEHDQNTTLLLQGFSYRFLIDVPPISFCFVRSALIALAVVQAAFREIVTDYAQVLRPEELNRFGAPTSAQAADDLLKPLR